MQGPEEQGMDCPGEVGWEFRSNFCFLQLKQEGMMGLGSASSWVQNLS